MGQDVLIAAAKKALKDMAGADDLDDTISMLVDPPTDPAVAVVDLPLVAQGPGFYAKHLLEKADCNAEQSDVVALIAEMLQRRWGRVQQQAGFADGALMALPTDVHGEVCSILLLGGGGCGKTYLLQKVITPLLQAYFPTGKGLLPLAPANAPARLLGGRTLHAAMGLTPASSLQTHALFPTGDALIRLQRLLEPLGGVAIDEIGQGAARLLHATALRSAAARAPMLKLNLADYMTPQNFFGAMPLLLLQGDFLQLPPIPNHNSLLNLSPDAAYEHRQGVAILQRVRYVCELKQMKRFTDPDLVTLLQIMRTPGGAPIPDRIWDRLEATRLDDDDDDPGGASQPADGDAQKADVPGGAAQPADVLPMQQAADYVFAAYSWPLVTIAMHVSARRTAAAAGSVLYYAQAVDQPSHSLTREHYWKMTQEPNLTKTKKIPGVAALHVGQRVKLTTVILPPHLVPEATGVVVGIDLHPAEPPIVHQPMLAEAGCVVLKFVPRAVYVRMDGVSARYLPDAPETPMDMTGVIAVKPIARTWSYEPEHGAGAVPVRRTGTPLVPVKAATLYGLQGMTADPGLLAAWHMPPRLPAATRWLAFYVMLSRARSLDVLRSIGLPDREILEGGPPAELTATETKLFHDRIVTTRLAVLAARLYLGW